MIPIHKTTNLIIKACVHFIRPPGARWVGIFVEAAKKHLRPENQSAQKPDDRFL